MRAACGPERAPPAALPRPPCAAGCRRTSHRRQACAAGLLRPTWHRRSAGAGRRSASCLAPQASADVADSLPPAPAAAAQACRGGRARAPLRALEHRVPRADGRREIHRLQEAPQAAERLLPWPAPRPPRRPPAAGPRARRRLASRPRPRRPRRHAPQRAQSRQRRRRPGRASGLRRGAGGRAPARGPRRRRDGAGAYAIARRRRVDQRPHDRHATAARQPRPAAP